MATSFLTDTDIAQFDAQQTGGIPPFLTDEDIAKFDQTLTPPVVSTPKWPSEQPPSFAEKFYNAIGAVGEQILPAVGILAEPIQRVFEHAPANVLTGIQETKPIKEIIKAGIAPLHKLTLEPEENKYLADVFRNYNKSLGAITGVSTTPVDEASAIAGGVGLRFLMPDIFNATSKVSRTTLKGIKNETIKSVENKLLKQYTRETPPIKAGEIGKAVRAGEISPEAGKVLSGLEKEFRTAPLGGVRPPGLQINIVQPQMPWLKLSKPEINLTLSRTGKIIQNAESQILTRAVKEVATKTPEVLPQILAQAEKISPELGRFLGSLGLRIAPPPTPITQEKITPKAVLTDADIAKIDAQVAPQPTITKPVVLTPQPAGIKPTTPNLEGVQRANPQLFRIAQKSKNADEFIEKVINSPSLGKITREKVDTNVLTDFYNKVSPPQPAEIKPLGIVYKKAEIISKQMGEIDRQIDIDRTKGLDTTVLENKSSGLYQDLLEINTQIKNIKSQATQPLAAKVSPPPQPSKYVTSAPAGTKIIPATPGFTPEQLATKAKGIPHELKPRKYKDYGEVWEAFREKKIKVNEPFTTKRYEGEVAKIIALKPPYEIDAMGLPKKYRIEEITQAKVQPEVTPAVVGKVKPSEKFVKAIEPKEPRITVTSETTPETIQKKLKELPLFPNKTENLSLLAKALQKAPDTWSGDKSDRVMVKVDGTWQIENSKTAIQKAIEGIRKPKLTPTKETKWIEGKEYFGIKTAPSQFRVISETPKAAKVEEVGELVPVEGKEYFTDGTMVIKGVPPSGSKFGEKPQVTKKAVSEILKEKTTPAEFQFYFTDIAGEISGRSDIPIATTNEYKPPYVVFRSKGKDVIFSQNKYNAIRNKFPEAKYGIRLSEDKGDMLIAYEDKEPVAALMAIKDVKIPPTEQDTNQQIQSIIRNSKSMAEAQKTIKKDLDMDITIADLKAAETQMKGGPPPNLAKHIIDDLTAKIKGKNKNADNDYGLSTIADITQDEVDDLVSTMGIAREKAAGVMANIRKGAYSLEMPQNFLYAYPDTKPIAEGVITTSVKQWKSDSEIEVFRKIAIKPKHPEVLAKIAVEADRDNSKNIFAMINTAVKEGKLNTTDRDAYFKGYYFLNKFVRDSLIKEIMDSRLGIRLKSDGWRYHVKYQTPSGVRVKVESKVSDRWVGGEELDKLQKQYSVDVIEQKEKVIFRHVDPQTGKYVTRTEMVDNYDQAVEMMGEEAKKLVAEILPYKNYIPHNRKGGKYWVEAFEPSVSGEPETKIFSARVPMRVNAEAIEKSLKVKFPRARVTINPHSEKMKFMPSMGSMADVQFFLMKNGIDPKSETGQRIINAYRSMSPLMSHLIHAQNIAGFKTDWNSITEGITDMAKSAVKREYRLDIKDLRELTKDIKDDFRYNTSIKYLDALGATGEGNPLLDAGKGLMYFWLLANKGTYIIQNMSEPLWAWARLGKINHPAKFMLHLPREYTNLIKQASEEGILKPFFELETVKEKGILFHLDVLGKGSEYLSSKKVFELGLRVARDKGLTGDEAYKEAYQFLFNIGKPFYNIANKPIFTIGPGGEQFRRYAFVLLNWVMDFVNKAFRGGAGFKAPVNRMLKTILGWILLCGLGTLPFGRKLLKKIGWVPKNPKDYTMKDKFLLAGAAGVAGVSPSFLVPIFQRWFKYGQFQGTQMSPFRGIEIVADKLLKVKSEDKKYGIAGALGQLPLAGAQYPIAGITKLKQGVKTGGVKPKVTYKPKSMWEKIVTAAGLTSFELGEYYEGKKTKKGKPSSLIIPKMK